MLFVIVLPRDCGGRVIGDVCINRGTGHMTRLANERRPVRGAGQSRAAVSFLLRFVPRLWRRIVFLMLFALRAERNATTPGSQLSRTSIAERPNGRTLVLSSLFL